jgi:hypothetical protein
MFEYGTKSDVEGRQASRVSYCRGAAVLSAVVGTLCLLSGRTVLGLGNLFLAISAGVCSLDKRRTH